MEKTLTLRLDKGQSEEIARRARATGKTRSAWVRDLIDKALASDSMEHRVGHLKGGIELPPSKSGWRRELKRRNWR